MAGVWLEAAQSLCGSFPPISNGLDRAWVLPPKTGFSWRVLSFDEDNPAVCPQLLPNLSKAVTHAAEGDGADSANRSVPHG